MQRIVLEEEFHVCPACLRKRGVGGGRAGCTASLMKPSKCSRRLNLGVKGHPLADPVPTVA
jgi:hypothetical protein